MKSLASSFFMLGRITTTEAKAKAVRPLVEKLLTRARHPNLANRRHLAGLLPPAAVRRALDEAKNFSNRDGGYTRVVKLGARKSDQAKMVILELVK